MSKVINGVLRHAKSADFYIEDLSTGEKYIYFSRFKTNLEELLTPLKIGDDIIHTAFDSHREELVREVALFKGMYEYRDSEVKLEYYPKEWFAQDFLDMYSLFQNQAVDLYYDSYFHGEVYCWVQAPFYEVSSRYFHRRLAREDSYLLNNVFIPEHVYEVYVRDLV